MTYERIDDIRTLISEQIPESLHYLEYKGSDILIKRDSATICKIVSAFANSAGGTLIIGINEQSQAFRMDDGTPGPSRRDWILKIVNSGTFPAVESLEVREFEISTGGIYVVRVDASAEAPHQSSDRKYYKRRGSHSEVMEHYEIEDVRSRPKHKAAPLIGEAAPTTRRSHLPASNE